MRTLIIIVGGLVFFALCLMAARWFALGTAYALAAKVFIPLWLLAAAWNMWMGVTGAGYSVAEELPIFLVIFLIPTAVVCFTWWKLGQG